MGMCGVTPQRLAKEQTGPLSRINAETLLSNNGAALPRMHAITFMNWSQVYTGKP